MLMSLLCPTVLPWVLALEDLSSTGETVEQTGARGHPRGGRLEWERLSGDKTCTTGETQARRGSFCTAAPTVSPFYRLLLPGRTEGSLARAGASGSQRAPVSPSPVG